ncbi:Rsd/AlgQ family anti-sigma factor [Vibrio rumoiensis]|uniref:Anti-RNA polymerase sigma 70 factor n=1 Tax=Vibrio rumoiensis 1S-45 TaxID=1188252 RepID=A0A1E5E688_9VIBR|nr:Rsd/AlgQ family anti-sigma factor [Vibrio rumoiensis]OEF29374.1 anti-RNA polymerase sigma 70 factor [Vibrio rumoiensis 1S-45]
MLNKLKQTQAQFGGSSDVIDHWLETRQNLIVEYWKLAAFEPSQHKKTALTKLPSPAELQNFCQHVVDYISEGHFKIYDMVMQKWQSTGFSPTEDIDQTYAKIVTTTEPLLNYTDKYAEVDAEDELEDFEFDLSQIGEVLEDRFELEDQLIQMIAESLEIPPGA